MLTFAFVVMKFSLLPFFILAEKQRWAGKAKNKVQEVFTLREDFYKPIPLLSYVICKSSGGALPKPLCTCSITETGNICPNRFCEGK